MRDSKRDTDVKNRLFDSMEESKGGMIWENRIETCVFGSVAQLCPILCDPMNLSTPGLPVHHHMWNRWPVQVRCMRQGTQGWCTWKGKPPGKPSLASKVSQFRSLWDNPEGWDGMGREVGGGFRMGHTSTPMADSCQCMEKPLQYCKEISLRLKQLIKKKKAETLLCQQRSI